MRVLLRFAYILVVAVVAAATSSAFAQRNLEPRPAQSEGRVALVIGNGGYKHAPLANPTNDASDIAKALQSMGFKVILRRNANAREMRQAIREFGGELRRAEVGLFYFAGHGLQLRGSNYLIPVGADIESEADAEDLAIDVNYALRTMDEAQVKVGIVILDACRNNPFLRNFRSASRGLAQMNAVTGSIIAFATAPGAVASDGKGRNGTYTKHLLASLAHPDSDVLKVFQRTRAAVVKETGGKQTPWESTSLVGDFYFKGGPTANTFDPAAIELSFWETIRSSSNPEDFKAYLNQYPNGRFAALAQNRVTQTEAAVITASVSPSSPAVAPTVHSELEKLAAGTTFRDCEECPEMVMIPAGSFAMGGSRKITFSKSFAVGKTEVTYAQWDACVRDRGCSRSPADFGWGRGDNPVVDVSWNDTQEYIAWLKDRTTKVYRLLSDAEWEYAARGGLTTENYWGENELENDACKYASVSVLGGRIIARVYEVRGCGLGRPSAVARRQPNKFGLYDMLGNASEWVEDCYYSGIDRVPANGASVQTRVCPHRVRRGGSWTDSTSSASLSSRGSGLPHARSTAIGFRVTRTE